MNITRCEQCGKPCRTAYCDDCLNHVREGWPGSPLGGGIGYSNRPDVSPAIRWVTSGERIGDS
jgi:hypothetical protein